MKKIMIFIITFSLCIMSTKAVETDTYYVNSTNNTVSTTAPTDKTTNGTINVPNTTTEDTNEPEVLEEQDQTINDDKKIDATEEEKEGTRITIDYKNVAIFFGMLFIVALVIILFTRNKEEVGTTYTEIKNSTLNKYLPEVKLETLEANLGNQFIEYLETIKNKDLEKLKIITNSILFEFTKNQIEELNDNNQFKMYDDYTIKESGVTGIKLENKRLVAEYYLDIEYVDCTKDLLEDKIVEGNQYYREHYIYSLKYYLSKEGNSKLIEVNKLKKI